MTNTPYILHLFTFIIGIAVGITATISTLKRANKKALQLTESQRKREVFNTIPFVKTFHVSYKGECLAVPIHNVKRGYEVDTPGQNEEMVYESITAFSENQKDEMNKMLTGEDYTATCHVVVTSNKKKQQKLLTNNFTDFYLVFKFIDTGDKIVSFKNK